VAAGKAKRNCEATCSLKEKANAKVLNEMIKWGLLPLEIN
jgi:hypothetical protein